jgi:hypothetical protein
MEAAEDVIKMVREIHDNEEHNVTEEKLSWYVRHQVNWEKEEEERLDYVEEKKDAAVEEEEDEGCPCDVFGEVCGDDDGDY